VGTTDYDEEKGKWYAKRDAGIPDASIKINGYWVPFKESSPFGNALNIGLAQLEQFNRPDKKTQSLWANRASRAGTMAGRFGKDMVNLNPMTSTEFTRDDFNSWAGSKASSITPGLNLKILQEIGEVMDRHPRKYWDQGFAAQYMIRIPGLREGLPKSKNFIGGEAERGDVTRRVLRMVDPLKVVKEKLPQSSLKATPLKKWFKFEPSKDEDEEDKD